MGKRDCLRERKKETGFGAREKKNRKRDRDGKERLSDREKERDRVW